MWHVTVAHLVACIFIAISRLRSLVLFLNRTRHLLFLLNKAVFFPCPHAALSPFDHFKSHWRQTLNRPIKFQLIYVTFQTWPIIHPRDNNKKDATWIKSDSQFYFYPEHIRTYEPFRWLMMHVCRVLLVLVTLMRWNLQAIGGTFHLEVGASLTGSIKIIFLFFFSPFHQFQSNQVKHLNCFFRNKSVQTVLSIS